MKKLLLVATALWAAMLSCPAQSDHARIKQLIDERGEFRIVSMTESKGDVVVFGDNDFYATDGVPEKFLAELNRLQKKNIRIVDLQHTDSGSWIVVYGQNEYALSLVGRPFLYRTMVAKLEELKKNKIPIRNLSFCDGGYWAIITKGSANDEGADSSVESIGELQGVLGMQGEHGNLLAVYFYELSCIAVYENGSVHYGDVPEDLLDMVSNENDGVTDVSFCGKSWFLSKGELEYIYDF